MVLAFQRIVKVHYVRKLTKFCINLSYSYNNFFIHKYFLDTNQMLEVIQEQMHRLTRNIETVILLQKINANDDTCDAMIQQPPPTHTEPEENVFMNEVRIL